MSGTRFKDRLIARGYEDAAKENISSDSPVASAAAQRFVFAACTERQWIPHSWDFSAAFLQGKYIERNCAIVIARPDGYAAPGIAWWLKKPVYRLCSAPKTWYDRVREVSSAAVLDCDAGIDALARTSVLARASMPAFVIHLSQKLLLLKGECAISLVQNMGL
jgi:Reverse transcriptase (RNA-dependent DNA polymerase)